MQPENEEKKEQEKRTREEWLLLLLSIIIILLLLLIFLCAGISYYRLQRNDVFRIRSNVIYYDTGYGEASEELQRIPEDIRSLPSVSPYDASQKDSSKGDDAPGTTEEASGRAPEGRNGKTGQGKEPLKIELLDGNAEKFLIDVDGLLYPGDRVTKEYALDITYTGSKKLYVDIPENGYFHEQKSGLAQQLECTVEINGDRHTDLMGGMHAEYQLPYTDAETKIIRICKVTIAVPKTFSDDYSQSGGSYQGEQIDRFAIEWQVR